MPSHHQKFSHQTKHQRISQLNVTGRRSHRGDMRHAKRKNQHRERNRKSRDWLNCNDRTFPLPRLWLLNGSGSEMMQIQNDRFIKNWSKGSANAKYPHYTPVIKPAFERDFNRFKTFVADEKLGAIKVNQCEVTYISHIIARR